MYRLFYLYFISIFISILFLFNLYIISIAAGHAGWAGCAGLAACCVVLGCGLGWGGWAAPVAPGCSWLPLAAPGCCGCLRLSRLQNEKCVDCGPNFEKLCAESWPEIQRHNLQCYCAWISCVDCFPGSKNSAFPKIPLGVFGRAWIFYRWKTAGFSHNSGVEKSTQNPRTIYAGFHAGFHAGVHACFHACFRSGFQ